MLHFSTIAFTIFRQHNWHLFCNFREIGNLYLQPCRWAMWRRAWPSLTALCPTLPPLTRAAAALAQTPSPPQNKVHFLIKNNSVPKIEFTISCFKYAFYTYISILSCLLKKQALYDRKISINNWKKKVLHFHKTD